MKKTELVEVGTLLANGDESRAAGVGLIGAFSRALRLQMLKDENLYLERRLAAMVLNNRFLQSVRSRKPAFKY